jgi:drug/metabolite transporter (DMT)-like permease
MRRLVAVGALLALDAAAAWADHPGALRGEGWSPVTAALVFGGLALLAGMLVIVIVTLLTRRGGDRPS